VKTTAASCRSRSGNLPCPPRRPAAQVRRFREMKPRQIDRTGRLVRQAKHVRSELRELPTTSGVWVEGSRLTR